MPESLRSSRQVARHVDDLLLPAGKRAQSDHFPDIGTRAGQRARPGVLARHPLVSFFLIAYAGAWLLELPIVLSRTGTGLLPYTLPPSWWSSAIAAATFTGPTLSAFVMARATEGREGPEAPAAPVRVCGV